MQAAEIIENLREQDFVVRADGDSLELSPREKVTEELIQRLREHKPEIIAELKREQRRAKILTILAENPETQRTFIADTESELNNVILAIAVRDQYTFELTIPKAKYDSFAFLELINKGLMQ